MKTVRIGCGAGFMGDRFDASLPILRSFAENPDGPRYLMFEVLAERTLAVAQNLRRTDPEAGYSPYLDHYIRPCLAEATRLGVPIVSNMGAANPTGAARRVHAIAAELGLSVTVAVVTGDDLTATLADADIHALPTMEGIDLDNRPVLAANVYLGARPVAEAVATGADVILVGRPTDSALALGPLIHEFGWTEEDLDRLAAGTVAGHLLECGGQVTGCYFADPGFKDVPDLAHAGFPIAEIAADGGMVITKPLDTGGLVDRRTVTEQLLYEMHDPAAYLVPDVTLDVTALTLDEDGPDRVRVRGARGHAPPETLKATVSVDGGWLGEAFMTYAGPNALARAELAGEIVATRMRDARTNVPIRIDVVGTGAVIDGGDATRRKARGLPKDGEYTVRVAVQSLDRATAERATTEMQALYCSGPAAGGGYRASVTAQVATASVLVPRDAVQPRVEIVAP